MTTLHDVPSAAELVEAVREFLEELQPTLDGRLGFHARVAANALGVVERELALGGADVREHQRRLAELGFGSDAELAAAIRSGAADVAEVRAVVADGVAAKLRVANPKYLGEQA